MNITELKFSKLPVWVVILLAIASVFLTCCVLCCVCRCIRKMRKKNKKNGKIEMKNGNNLTLFYQEIQPDLDNLNDEKDGEENNLGRLHYSLDYDFAKDELTVGVMELADLAAMDAGGMSDPYVRVYLLPEKKKRFDTKIHKKTLNPIFGESFVFKALFDDLHLKTLVFTVYDYDRFTKHDVIGQVRVEMKEVDVAQVIDKWCHLDPTDSDAPKEVPLGDICFSLRYVPTSGKLTVVVIEAKNLKKMDLSGLSDPYVRLSLYSGNKKLKKKKTTVKKSTLNPYFNEEFIFDITFEQMQKAYLLVTVLDHDKLSAADEIGHVKLGMTSAGTELRHWTEMLTHPRKPIANWHTLKED